MGLIDMKVASLTAALFALRQGVSSQTLSYPNPEPQTRNVTAEDIPSLRAELLSLEAQRFNRHSRGVA